jgi:hypothetical protein
MPTAIELTASSSAVPTSAYTGPTGRHAGSGPVCVDSVIWQLSVPPGPLQSRLATPWSTPPRALKTMDDAIENYAAKLLAETQEEIVRADTKAEILFAV